ncbi:MAG: cation:proton antiporter [Gammaproteobacteria bacterium]|nr:cation:proton antiporter [Gammaproteobacteria bacterium]
METHSFFIDLLIILIAARIFAELAVRMYAPSVIGELFAGIVLGPSLFGWITISETIRLMAEIGIILLLFEVGLETNIKSLIHSRGKSVVIALCGFFFPFILGFIVSYNIFSLSLLTSLFVGGTITATSIGITVRVLTDLNLEQSRIGQIVLGAAVIDDVLGVMLLALLYEFSIGGGINLLNVGKVFLFVSAFFVLAPVVARLISLLINRFDSISEIPGLIPTSIISLVLFFAWLAHVMGAPELLGGFAAGLALSRRFFIPFGIALHADEGFADRIESQMKPIIQLFTPIFFVFVGLSLALRDIDWSSPTVWLFTLFLFSVAFVGKMLGSTFIRENRFSRYMVGLSMVPRGEVGLIFAELGREGGIFSNEIYASLVLVIALTTILPPLLMKWLNSRESIIN